MKLNIQQQAHIIQVVNFIISLYGIFYLYITGNYWLLGVSYLIVFVYTLVGLQAGYHRLLTHKSYTTSKMMEYIMSSIGILCIVGSPIAWVSAHRQHHRYPDTEKDPHSPHHIGWRSLFANYQYQWDKWPIRELIVDPVHRLVHDRYFLLLIVWFAGLASIGINVLLYIGIIPMALAIWVSTISNYLNHYFGYRTYKTTDKSRNLWITAYLTFGEGWHNNHHAHSNEYRFGKRWWELDLGAWIIEHGLKA